MRQIRSLSRSLRWLIAATVLLLAVALLVLAGNQLLALKARLAGEPVWMQLAVLAGGLGALAALALALRRLLFPSPVPAEAESDVPDEASLRSRVVHWEREGVDVSTARDELAELERRREERTTHVAVYGTISSGKSALIRALVPGAQAPSDVVGGTTERVQHFDWSAGDGERLVLADVPGFAHAAGAGETVAREEAGRADLVLFVAEGDLTREEWRALSALRELGKPLVVALNKADRYAQADREAIRARLAERLGGDAAAVVAVVAGGTDEVVRRDADGHEFRERRQRPADVRALRRALQHALDDAGGLAARRDRAVFLLTARKLEGAVNAHRRDAAEALVERYGRRAVVGALAAVAPGSDLVIQGGLAAGLVRELCSLYEVSWREVAAERFIAGLRQRAHTATPLFLGVAGNALKAFPGVGTLAGGLVHAVAYGLLFRTAGRALVDSLQARGELRADDALERFEEGLREDMATPARGLARVALEAREPDDHRD